MEVAATSLARRQFLRGDVKQRHAPTRPPWAIPEARFTVDCTRCGDCVDACGQQLIAIASGGFPEVRWQGNGCTFCGDCVTACEPRALMGDTGDPATAWSLRAKVQTHCLAQQGVVCRTCGDVCDANAIHFQLQLGGRAYPLVDPQLCTGCGSCMRPCPVDAIAIE